MYMRFFWLNVSCLVHTVFQTSGYESEPSSTRSGVGGGGGGDLGSTLSDGGSMLSSAGGSSSEVGGTLGSAGSTDEGIQGSEPKEEDWVAVQRKKKSSNRNETKVRTLLMRVLGADMIGCIDTRHTRQHRSRNISRKYL